MENPVFNLKDVRREDNRHHKNCRRRGVACYITYFRFMSSVWCSIRPLGNGRWHGEVLSSVDKKREGRRDRETPAFFFFQN